jgi:hypothetical protein
MNTFLRIVHIFALSLWFGSVTFFLFFTAIPIFNHFEAQATRPSYWLQPQVSEKKQGTRIAGDALEPVFAKYFYLQVLCAAAAFLTARSWSRPLGRAATFRRVVLFAGLALACLNAFYLADRVHEIRGERYARDSEVAAAAEQQFGAWHTASLLTDVVGLLCAAVALAAGALPPKQNILQP